MISTQAQCWSSVCGLLLIASCGRIGYVANDADSNSQQVDAAGVAGLQEAAFGNVLSFPFEPTTRHFVEDHSQGLHHGNTRGPYRTTDGVHGNALLGDYVGQHVVIADHADLFVGNQFTLELWIYLGPMSLPLTLYADASEAELAIELASPTQVILNSNAGCGGVGLVDVAIGLSTGIAIGEWTHLALSWDGKIARVYLAGQELGQSPFEHQPCEVPNAPYSLTPPFEGAVDDFKLWGEARSASQILESMNFDTESQESYCSDGVLQGLEQCEQALQCCESTTCRFSAVGSRCGAGTCDRGVCTSNQGVFRGGLVAEYGFNEGNGTVVADAIEPRLDLTIPDLGMVRWGDGHLALTNPVILMSSSAATKISAAIIASNESTLEAWVLPSGPVHQGPARIVSMSSSIRDVNFFLGQDNAHYAARFGVTGSADEGQPDIYAEGIATVPKLTHVVLTVGTDQVRRLYIDGTLRTSMRVSGDTSIWNETWTLNVGNEFDLVRPWLGELHLIRIYSQALTHEQIGANFVAGSEG